MSSGVSRRASREAALRGIYSDKSGGDLDLALRSACEDLEITEQRFARDLANGAIENRLEHLELIKPCLNKGWTLERLAVIDILILILAIEELQNQPGISPKVTIAEAVRLAKKYSGKESYRFINGVLGNILPKTAKNEWDPRMEEKEPMESEPEKAAPIQEEEIVEGSPEHDEVLKASPWVIKSDDMS